MIFLRSTSLDAQPGGYPMNSPAVLSLKRYEFSASVTLIAGENGSGKSTYLEALAKKLRLPSIGARDAEQDPTLQGVGPLADGMRTVFARRHRWGFFLRAEDFFGYTQRVAGLQREMREELTRVERENAHRSVLAQGYARMAYAGSLGALEGDHGADPDARSHGESFLALFQRRIVPGGLYLLDEPEAPLSPLRQLSLIRLIMEREDDSQFLIATHSPMLLAYPGARILNFDGERASEVEYGSLSGVCLTRDFLNAPERYLKMLRED